MQHVEAAVREDDPAAGAAVRVERRLQPVGVEHPRRPLDARPQRLAAADARARLAHDHVGGELGERRGLAQRLAAREGEREGGREGVAGAVRHGVGRRMRDGAARPVRGVHDGAVTVEGDHDPGRTGGGEQLVAEERGGCDPVRSERAPEQPLGLARVRRDGRGGEHRPWPEVVGVDDGHGRPGVARGESLTHRAGGRSDAVVADELRIRVTRRRERCRRHERAGVVGHGVALVEAHEHLAAAGDSRLHRRGEARYPDEARDVDARLLEQRRQRRPARVLADRADDRHVRAERREVHRRVRGAARHIRAIRDPHDRRRRLTADALGAARPPSVEQRVAEHHDPRAAPVEARADPAHERGGVRRHRAPPGRPRCTTVVVVISSSSSGP